MRQDRTAWCARLCAAFVLLAGCRATQVPAAGSTRAQRPGELAMRPPGESASPASRATLGDLEAVEVAARETSAATAGERADAVPPPPPPIVVDDSSSRRPVTLREQTLVLPGGLILHQVPRGARVQLRSEAATGADVWEIVDARERRLALIKARSWRRAGVVGETGILEETAGVRGIARTTRWGSVATRIITDRFQSETHLYILERRAAGSSWIWSGLELATPR